MLTGTTPATSPQGGLVFTGCAMLSAAAETSSHGHGHGQGHAHAHAGPRRREVVVNGKRVKTVDMHAHCCVPSAMAVIKSPLEAPGLLMDDTSTRIAAMDAQGIDVEALSINPYWYRAGRDAAAELISIQNETLVEFCAANPERFVAYATAALQHPDLAAEQVEHAVKKLGFRGVGVGGSVDGMELADPMIIPPPWMWNSAARPVAPGAASPRMPLTAAKATSSSSRPPATMITRPAQSVWSRHLARPCLRRQSGSRAPSSERFPRRFRRTMRCVCAECRRCRGTVIGHCCDAPTGARAAPATHLNIKIIIHTQKYVSKQIYIYTYIFIYVYFF